LALHISENINPNPPNPARSSRKATCPSCAMGARASRFSMVFPPMDRGVFRMSGSAVGIIEIYHSSNLILRKRYYHREHRGHREKIIKKRTSNIEHSTLSIEKKANRVEPLVSIVGAFNVLFF
jgi:hypothetical protein